MSKTKNDEYRELVLMVGITAAGKSYYVNRNYSRDHQIISETHIQEAMNIERIGKDENFKHIIMAVITRSIMLMGLPIVVDEPNLFLESLFIWKQLALFHKYRTKVIIVDTPLEICLERLKDTLPNGLDEKLKEKVIQQNEQLQEIKTILSMKHQPLVDEIEFISHGGNE